ncbi:MAG TPA: hypothetical protein VMM12_17940 [Longimicrobiales bacterium]|nr:hypothetical protein [Longimicrobiales bacterium]
MEPGVGGGLKGVRGLVEELKRRRVFRAAAWYGGAAFVVLQAADLVLPALGASEWVMTGLVVASLLGLPLVLVLSWTFEVTGAGLQQETTPPAPPDPGEEGPGGGEAAGSRRATRRAWGAGVLGVAAAAAVVLGGLWLAAGPGAPAIERIGVLPASNMSRDPEQDYFVDGVHEALVGELQRAGIATIARQSVLQYRETDKPIRQIAGELGVDALIELAVGREADSVFVDVSLFDGRTQLPLWTASFASEIRGVLGLYREVSRRIAVEVGAVLSDRVRVRLAERPTLDPRVLEAVTRGNFHLGRGTPQDLGLALQHFESALELDSLFPPAHVGVATAWGMRAQGLLIAPSEALPLVRTHLARALELDPDLAAARALEAGHSVWVDWEFEAGAAEYRHALELDPNDARTRAFYGHVLMILGRWDEAIRQGELAMELDRLDPFVAGLYGAILTSTGHGQQAIELIEATLEANPGVRFGLAPLFNALHGEARYEEELQYRRAFYASRGEDEAVEALDRGFEEGGYRAGLTRAAAVLASQARDRGVGYMPAAQLYATAGEGDLAMDLLEMAVEVRESPLPYLGVIPGFWSLHDDPRFRAIARQVGVRPLRPSAS